MNTVRKIFIDEATNIPAAYGNLPESFHCRANVQLVQKGGTPGIELHGMAEDSAAGYQLFFDTGEGYWDTRNTTPPSGTLIPHVLCSPVDQLNELSEQFVGLPLRSAGVFDLPANRKNCLQSEGQKDLQFQLEVYRTVSRFSSVPVEVQCTGTILDGALCVYAFTKNQRPMALYSTLWRIGMTIAVQARMGLFGMPQNTGGTTTSWVVPLVMNMTAEGNPNQETLNMFNEFVDSFDRSDQLKAYQEQIAGKVAQDGINQAAVSAQQTQTMMNNLMQQQNAAWDRVQAQGKQLSQDLDAFRAGQAANAAAMDAFHQQMHSMNSAPSSFSGYGTSFTAESLDDRVQRLRHESMMGVNTYEREDGSTYEHSIQADRVFENNLDQNLHFGTQNYVDDYVPDMWTELSRKK